MSIWVCPRCEERGRSSIMLSGISDTTVCHRCGYKRGSNDRLEKKTRKEDEDVARMKRSLGGLLPPGF